MLEFTGEVRHDVEASLGLSGESDDLLVDLHGEFVALLDDEDIGEFLEDLDVVLVDEGEILVDVFGLGVLALRLVE